jgi:ribonuclease HII
MTEPDVRRLQAGVDEAGRGALCGNLVVAICVLDLPIAIAGLADSKKLSHAQRLRLDREIRARARFLRVVSVSPQRIDQVNILQATLQGMAEAIAGLPMPVDPVYIDGNRLPDCACPMRAVVGGDATIPAISAASIVAKVERDRQMMELHQKFPGYGFDRHKGYPTQLHRQRIRELGLLPCYRRSYGPVRDLLAGEN